MMIVVNGHGNPNDLTAVLARAMVYSHDTGPEVEADLGLYGREIPLVGPALDGSTPPRSSALRCVKSRMSAWPPCATRPKATGAPA